MPIAFKSPLSSSVANDTFVDKTIDDIKKGKLSFFKVDISDVDAIDDIQDFTNEIANTIGQTGEGDLTRKTYSSHEIITDGDDRKVAIGKLDAQVKVNLDSNTAQDVILADHEIRITDNRTDIDQNIIDIGQNADDITAINDSIGQPNGIAELDGNGTVPLAQLPQSAFDGLSPQGDWDALTNTPDIGAIVPPAINIGDFWVVTVEGTTNLGGITVWGIGDWAIYTDAGWIKNIASAVVSVNGQTGTVVLDKTDVGLTNVTDDAQLKRADNDWIGFTEKLEPVDNDIVLIEEETTGAKKKVRLENLLGGGGAGGSTAWIDGDIAPLNGYVNGIETKDFDGESGQEMFINVVVPDSYKPGKQIKLLSTLFFANDTVGNVYMKCDTTIIKAGEDATANVNTHVSTNTEKLLSDANDIIAVGEIDLSTNIGEINSIPIAIGDLLIVRLYRDFNNETLIANTDARILKYSASVSFKG